MPVHSIETSLSMIQLREVSLLNQWIEIAIFLIFDCINLLNGFYCCLATNNIKTVRESDRAGGSGDSNHKIITEIILWYCEKKYWGLYTEGYNALSGKCWYSVCLYIYTLKSKCFPMPLWSRNIFNKRSIWKYCFFYQQCCNLLILYLVLSLDASMWKCVYYQWTLLKSKSSTIHIFSQCCTSSICLSQLFCGRYIKFYFWSVNIEIVNVYNLSTCDIQIPYLLLIMLTCVPLGLPPSVTLYVSHTFNLIN